MIKSIKIILASVFGLIILYGVSTEFFLIYNFKTKILSDGSTYDIVLMDKSRISDDKIGVSISGTHDNFSFQRNFIFAPKNSILQVFNPFSFLAKKIYLNKKYFICFEGIEEAAPLNSRIHANWFDNYGYIYSFDAFGYADDPINHEQVKYEKIFPKKAKPTTAKIVEKDDCDNYDSLEYLHQYKVRWIH